MDKRGVRARLQLLGGGRARVEVVGEAAVFAPTPGQYAVFYVDVAAERLCAPPRHWKPLDIGGLDGETIDSSIDERGETEDEGRGEGLQMLLGCGVIESADNLIALESHIAQYM